MASAVKYNIFVEDLGRKVHNLDSDTLRIALTNTAPNVATHTVLADITEIVDGNGYTSGSSGAVASNDYTGTAGTAALTGSDVVFTASGGSFAAARYAVLYNDTSTSDSLIQYWDYGSSFTLLTGETFTVDFSTNILTLA